MRRVQPWQDEEVGRRHPALAARPHHREGGAKRDQRGRRVGRMDDVAGTAAEDRVELVLAGEREALIPAVLVALEAVPEVPAPRTLTHVAGDGADVANLWRRRAAGALGEHGVILPEAVVPTDGVERRLAADDDARCRRRDLVQVCHRLQIHDDVGLDDALLHKLQHIAAAACEDGGLARFPRLGGAA